ncbi:MAG: dephospho-CoA kinase [Candidatus Omnitrophota bacterium]
MIIGITGGFGTGKSTVAGLFKAKGAYIIDADRINHGLLKEKTVINKIHRIFGKGVLRKAKTIDRKALAKEVFGSKRNLERLCRITHPLIISKIRENIKKINKNRLIVIDAPLLIEADLRKFINFLIVVKAGPETSLKRLKRKGFLKNEVFTRRRMQIPLRNKLKLADFVIDNNGSMENLAQQVNRIFRAL